MKHSLLKISCLVFLFFASSCSLFELEENLDNPNDVAVDKLDVNLLMNKIQADFGDFFAESNTPGMELSRMASLINGGTYATAYQAQDLDDPWERGYQDVLLQIETLLAKTDGTGFTKHSGAARVMKAYVLLTLVDLFGDVPYTAALKGFDGAANFNPKADSGKSIYEAAITLLDEALALLATAPAAGSDMTRDIFYGANAAKWSALANTLKLKAYMNLRLTTDVTAKVTELLGKDLIDTDAEEFTYKYGTATNPARSRHPLYRQMYQSPAGSASGYIGNYFMLVSYKQKGVEDPRWRYYFFRQVGSIAAALSDEPESIPCIISPRPAHYGPNQAWCAFDPGFYGRDHGNDDGIPPDAGALTCYGVYPAGGLADVNDGDPEYRLLSVSGQGPNGGGIEPIWMASFTDFLKAEAALTITGVGGDAKALMMSAVNKSINRVRAFADAKGQSLPGGLEPSQTDYANAVSALWDGTADPNERLSILSKEYYIALWGNGIEGYNLYRRTGKPSDMQPMRSTNPGVFLRSLIYPAVYANLNESATQKNANVVNKVFWDNNPDNFVY